MARLRASRSTTPSLSQITHAELATGALFGHVGHHFIKRHNREDALTQVDEHSVDGDSVQPGGEG